jgi:hypothetical protein
MNTTVTKPEKVQNYTQEQCDFLTAASPFDWEQAKVIGLAMDKSPQSIVAKVGNMKLPYTTKPVPKKKAVQDTKVELVASIQAMIDRDLSGLEKSTRQAILNLQNGILHILPVKTETPLPEIGDSE